MNEQIREMWRQAVLNNTKTPMNFQDVADQFASLIVKKCANIVWDEAEKTMSSEVNDAGYKIIEYFGVAESE